jgi:hypothetical protein
MPADDDAPAATGASDKDSSRKFSAKDGTSGRVTVDDVLEVATRAGLCHDSRGHGYATVTNGAGALTHRVESPEFRYWLRMASREEHGVRPESGVLQSAIELLGEQARFEAPEEDIFLRVGHADGVTYVDLGDSTGRVAEIDSTGFRLLVRSPVKFWRSRGMKALPEPRAGGSIYELGDVLNLGADDFDLVIIGLLAQLIPRGPYPVLEFGGEQGSAKTTASRLVCSLVDPRVPLLVGDPREPRDLLIKAEHSWVIGVDNLSSMPKALADVMCRVTTGTGASVKQNYTDTDEVLFSACRPIVMNGIPELAVRPDLADRTLRVECRIIPDRQRRTDERVNLQFSLVHPSVLGGLFQAASTAMANMAETRRRVQRLPRLADVALQAEAAAPALDWEDGKAVGLMLDMRSRYRQRLLEGDVIAKAIVARAQRKWGNGWVSESPWVW